MTPAIFGISGLSLSAEERAFFKECAPAGYILFGRNICDKAQLRALTDDLRELHGNDHLFICIDQEGGRVARLRPPVWSAFPASAVFDSLYQTAPASAIEAARANAHALALELAEVGVSVDCHPPLDVRQAGAHDVIGDRALGSDPMQVAALGSAILDGLSEGGVVGCVKHMPGHGRTTTDTHQSMPTVTASAAELEVDIAPFRKLNSALIGMTGHLLFTEWDKDNPATLSPTIIADIIRKDIGFDGLLLTDDIDMEALDGSIAERSAKSIAAGCDLVLNCWAKMDDMEAIVDALPAASAATRARLEAVEQAIVPAASGSVGSGDAGERVTELLAKRDALLAAQEAVA